MTDLKSYGFSLPEVKKKKTPGKLIVLEGTDGVGRSTQIALLREWLESEGYAVAATGLKRGRLAGKAIQKAMMGHTLGDLTMDLAYATDFADRLEKEIIPALRAGFVVLLDRYIYSIIARAQARDADPKWIRDVLGFAIIPDISFYLHADIAHLVPRVLNVRGFSYWESGMDHLKGRDYYDTFVEYQTHLIAQFDAMADEFEFIRIDANQSILEVFQALRAEIKDAIRDMKVPKELKKELKKKLEAEEKEKIEGEDGRARKGERVEQETEPPVEIDAMVEEEEPEEVQKSE